MNATDDLSRTPLWERHRRMDARMVPFAGYEMPLQYEGIVAEHHAVRQHAGLFDVSHMGRLFFEGPAALRFVDAHVAGPVWKMPVGKALYTVCCNEEGGIDDDLIVYRLAEERVLVICNAANRAAISGLFARSLREGRAPLAPSHTLPDGARRAVDPTEPLAPDPPCFEDRTEQSALLALQGPKAVEIARAAGLEEAAFRLRPFQCVTTRLDGVELLCARTGYTGEDGFELLVTDAEAPRIWDALLEAGARPCGLGARDTLRLEARLLLHGQDMDATTTPFACGLSWTISLQKGEPPYRGREALLRAKRKAPSDKLVGFVLEEKGIARPGHELLDPADPERRIGRVTSGAPSPTLRKSIGLGYVRSERARPDEPLLVQVRTRRLRARIVKGPFYRRSK